MIYLTKGQTFFNNEGMVVYDESGYYEDGAAVVCAMAFAPEEPVCRYEAKFIAYGDQVYNIGDEIKLTEEITKIDPENLFGKTNDDIKVDEMVESIETEQPSDLKDEEEYEEEDEEEVEEDIIEEEEDTIKEDQSEDINQAEDQAGDLEQGDQEEGVEVIEEIIEEKPVSLLTSKRKRKLS